MKGVDAVGKRIDAKLSNGVDTDGILTRYDIGANDAAALVAAIRSHGALRRPEIPCEASLLLL